MASYSSCLINGQYLVDFYIPHPSDYRYNAILNQRFWLQYHSRDKPIPHQQTLICSVLLTHPKPMLIAINSSLFATISTLLTRTHSFMVRSNSLPSTNGRVVTESVNSTGIYLNPTAISITTQFHVLMCRPIQSMSMPAHTPLLLCYFRICTSFVGATRISHNHQLEHIPLTKGLGYADAPNIFFSFLYTTFWGGHDKV